MAGSEEGVLASCASAIPIQAYRSFPTPTIKEKYD